MFRALLAHPQEVVHKRNLVECVRITSVGCGTFAVLTSHARNIPNAVCVAAAENEQVMLETFRGLGFSIH
jgi:hypothetical protein